ncbi:hypothetical protein Sjap_017281 [Stephania japonica]|uniref:Uncharacterized protein n=1 Tax=Stephania japonica TaxID=461633 RepID=A0AAP0I5V5_9MAGN
MKKDGEVEMWLLSDKNDEFEWEKRLTLSLQKIVKENWNIMSKICEELNIEERNEVVKAFCSSPLRLSSALFGVPLIPLHPHPSPSPDLDLFLGNEDFATRREMKWKKGYAQRRKCLSARCFVGFVILLTVKQ